MQRKLAAIGRSEVKVPDFAKDHALVCGTALSCEEEGTVVTPAEIHTRIKERFGDHVLEFEESLANPSIKLVPEVAAEVGKYLKDDPDLQFNYLMCLSGVDYGAGQSLGVVYHLQSMTLMHQIVLKVELPRDES